MCAPGNAVDSLTLEIARVQQSGILARDIRVDVRLADKHQSFTQIRVAELNLPQIGVLTDLRIECAEPLAQDFVYRCDDARIRARSPRFGAQDLRARVSWDDRRKIFTVHAGGLRVAGGSLALDGRWTARGWSLQIDATALAVAQLQQLAGSSLPPLPGLSIEGRLSTLNASLSGAAAIATLRVRAELAGIALGNPDGTIATDQLGVQLRLDATRSTGAWRFDAELGSARGEALAGRWYWNFAQQPLVSDWHGQWRDDGVLALDQGRWRLGTFMRAAASGEIGTSSKPLLRRLDVTVDALDAAALPPQTRDGLLAASPVSQLQGSGRLQGRIDIEDDAAAAADLVLDALTLEDGNARLKVAGLSGRILWHSLERRKQALSTEDRPTPSSLSWEAGLLYGVQIGAAKLHFTTAGSDVRLVEGVRIPILDGGLDIRVLQLRHIGDPAMAIRFDAALDPINIGLLSKAFGWPEFAGTLSGRIPDLNLEAGVLTLGGALQAAVFNGALSVKDLQLKDAFGARPRLTANMAFSRLDLAAITSAFAVGRITGRIDGRVDGLELVGWEPVSFDARLYSTPGDRARKRISQRAVQNISSIGGGLGAAAAIQRSALRFFDEFNYARLGISCRLKNDVCEMDGVEARPPGYYLVKGWGLPRIDVIGNARRVDWQRLVRTLKELPESQAAIGEAP